MQSQMQKLDVVGLWLDRVNALPIGHPDRLRFLIRAERILTGSLPATKNITN